MKKIIDKELGIENAGEIEFQNVHRLKPRQDGNPRSIIARFVNYANHQKEAPAKLEFKPRYSVYQQEITDRRKALVPKLKEFQRAN